MTAMGRRGAGAPTALGVPTFRRLLTAWTIGNLADSALFLTLAVWMKELTGSSSAAGLVFLALGAPVFLSPLIGVLTDRMSRRWLLVAGNLFGATAATALLLVQDRSQVWLIYVVAFAYGSLGILNSSAQAGLLRDLLPDELLDGANGMLTTIDQGLRLVTPALGVVVFSLAGPATLAIGVAALLCTTAALLAATTIDETPPAPRDPSESFWAENVAGLHHVRDVPVLWRMFVVGAVAFSVVGSFDTLLFEIIERGIDRSPDFAAVLISTQGAGAVVGGLTAAAVLRRRGPLRTVGAALATMAGAVALMLATLSIRPQMPIVVAAMALAGLAIPWLIVAVATTRIRLTPAQLQGRTAAAMNMGLTIPQLTSSAAGALAVSIVDYRWVMALAVVVLTACAASLLLDRRQLDPEALDPEPLDPERDAGPEGTLVT